ncbi:hypothetical protein YC2023_044206 [Brassica napus]
MEEDSVRRLPRSLPRSLVVHYILEDFREVFQIWYGSVHPRCFVSSWFCWSKQQLLLPLIGASRYELLVGAPASLLSANRRAVVANTLS